ncbi:MAG: NYN domain-containing protein [Thermoguttaceae bacterium]|jgi:uncharacterized LabA/DUF88 family protein
MSVWAGTIATRRHRREQFGKPGACVPSARVRTRVLRGGHTAESAVREKQKSDRKKVDTGIATEIVADLYELMRPGRDEITLEAGDADYVPTVERVRKRGIDFHVVFWDHAAKELRDAATKFISLNPFLDHLRRK